MNIKRYVMKKYLHRCLLFCYLKLNEIAVFWSRITIPLVNLFHESAVASCKYFYYYRYYLEPIVGPAAKFHFTVLIIKREPCNIYLTCRLKDAWRNICALSLMSHHHICWICAIKSFISTGSILIYAIIENIFRHKISKLTLARTFFRVNQ